MVDKRGGIVFRAELRLPKVFVGRFKAEIKIETIAKDNDDSAMFIHLLLVDCFNGFLKEERFLEHPVSGFRPFSAIFHVD